MGADSRPGVAGTRTIRFVPPAETTSNPFFSAHALNVSHRRFLVTRRARDARQSASKCFQSNAGSAPSNGSVISSTPLLS